VLFFPLWGRFPALSWECAAIQDDKMAEAVPLPCQTSLGENWGRAQHSAIAEKMHVAAMRDKGLTLERGRKCNNDAS
jgi:hypothetical protein